MPPFGGRHKNPTSTERRQVIVSSRCEPRDRLWAFGYADLAHLLGVTEERVRNMVCDNELDPGHLEQVCRAWAKRNPGHEYDALVGPP